MTCENWDCETVIDVVIKSSSYLETHFFENDLYFTSSNYEKNLVNLYKNKLLVKKFFGECEESYGVFVKFNSKKLCIASLHNVYLYDIETYELLEKHVFAETITCVDFENGVIFVKSDKLYLISNNEIKDIDFVCDKFNVKYVNSTFYFAGTFENNTKIFIQSSVDLTNWTKNKEYKFSGVKSVSFECEPLNNKLWMIVCDKLNIKLFQCDLSNNKWNHFYSILYHNEHLLKSALGKCDIGGKFWIISHDEKNNVCLYEKDDEMMQLKLIRTIENENNIVFGAFINEKLDVSIIIENLLNDDVVRIGKYDENDKEKIREFIETFKNKELVVKNIDFKIDTVNNSENENKFADYYKMIFNLLNEALSNNKHNDDYLKYGYILKKFMMDNFIKKQNCIDVQFCLYTYKKNAFIYDNNEDLLIHLHIINNNVYSVLNDDNKLKIRDEHKKITKHTSIYNFTDGEIRLFYNEKNYIIEQNNYFECISQNIYKSNKFELFDNDANKTCNKINGIFNSGLLTIGFVSQENSEDYPLEYDNLYFGENDRYLAINFNGKNYFPNGELDKNFKLKNINNVLINFYSKKLSNDINQKNIDNILYMVLSNKISFNEVFYSEFKSCFDVDDDEQTEWKTLSGETMNLKFFSFDMLFYNKTDIKITITFDIAMFFESINFVLDKKHFIFGKLIGENKIRIDNFATKHEYMYDNIISLMDNYVKLE